MKNYWFIKLTFCNKKPWVSHWFLRHRAVNYSCGCNAHVCATFSVAVSTGLKTSVVIILVRNSLCSSPPRRGLAAVLPPGLNAPGPDSANTVWGKNTVDVKNKTSVLVLFYIGPWATRLGALPYTKSRGVIPSLLRERGVLAQRLQGMRLRPNVPTALRHRPWRKRSTCSHHSASRRPLYKQSRSPLHTQLLSPCS